MVHRISLYFDAGRINHIFQGYFIDPGAIIWLPW